MLHYLRRHRQRLGRTFAGLFAFAWMTVALQPCAVAQASGTQDVAAEHSLTDVMDHALMDHAAVDHAAVDHAAMDHASMDHATMGHATMDHATMDHATMDHATMDHAVGADEPCPPGAECPVFKAVADQAASKSADPFDLPLQPVPVPMASWRVPAPPAPRQAFGARTASVPIPQPPTLAFRVLLI